MRFAGRLITVQRVEDGSPQELLDEGCGDAVEAFGETGNVGEGESERLCVVAQQPSTASSRSNSAIRSPR